MLLEFQIEEILGQGGFGITYRARDTLLDEQVAIKEFFPSGLAARARGLTARAKSAQDRDAFGAGLKAFLDEARIIARFRHRNIIQVRRFFEAHGTGYIVLQFESGRSFEDVVEDGPLPEAEILAILDGILDGLAVVHAQAVLHRDLKPRNVIIRADGTPVLIDFGSARDFNARDSRTVTKMVSPGYSPPEQYGVGSQSGPWSDFYALGAMLYRAITGKIPADSLRRLRNDPVVPALELAGGQYSKPLLQIIDAMMQIDESKRPGSVAAIREALAHPPAEMPASTTERPDNRKTGAPVGTAAYDWAPALPETQGVSPQRRRLAALAALGLVVLAAGGVAYWRLATTAPVTPIPPPPELTVSGGTDQSGKAEDRPKRPSAGATAPLRPSGDTAGETVATPGRPAEAKPPTARDAFTPGTFFRDCPTCPELAILPPGRFAMGSKTGLPYEQPMHGVALTKPFAIGRREVTFAEWDACVAGGGCDFKAPDQGWGRGTRPVIGVSWLDATAYVAWLSKTTGATYRLPSEAEWEYAARGGTVTSFWWGAEAGEDHANCSDCRNPPLTTTQPTASYPPNAYGLYDTAGNAAEWTQDCWTDSYDNAPADGAAVQRPDCEQRVLRGGSFDNDSTYARSAARFRYEPSVRYYANGFRVVREAKRP